MPEIGLEKNFSGSPSNNISDCLSAFSNIGPRIKANTSGGISYLNFLAK
jgi:hypothetical protein